MLKLIYLEDDFRLELVNQSLEAWIKARVTIALRAGISFWLDPSTASFLLPADLPLLADLEKEIQPELGDTIELSRSDNDSFEVSLQGTWVTSALNDEEGVFVTSMSDRAEFFLCKLWQEAQALTSAVAE